jgi:hypothetical protein
LEMHEQNPPEGINPRIGEMLSWRMIRRDEMPTDIGSKIIKEGEMGIQNIVKGRDGMRIESHGDGIIVIR